MNDSFMTVREAAKRIGVSTRTLRRWDEQGVLKSIRFPIGNAGKRTNRRYRPEDIERLFQTRYVPKKQNENTHV